MAEPAFVGAGSTEGLELWRIENLKPVKRPSSEIGKFFKGDSYILLKTKAGTFEYPGFSRSMDIFIPLTQFMKILLPLFTFLRCQQEGVSHSLLAGQRELSGRERRSGIQNCRA